MLTKICEHCKRVIPAHEVCGCWRDNTVRKHNEESAAFYHSKQWNLLAKAAASRANYVDEYLLRYEGKVKPGRIVHHIIPVKEDKAHALSPKNLVYLSDKTHALVHKAYDKSREDKMAMQAKLAMIRMDY